LEHAHEQACEDQPPLQRVERLGDGPERQTQLGGESDVNDQVRPTELGAITGLAEVQKCRSAAMVFRQRVVVKGVHPRCTNRTSCARLDVGQQKTGHIVLSLRRIIEPISVFPSQTERHGQVLASCFEFFTEVGLAKRDNDGSQIEQIREFVRDHHVDSNL
jgi:hypothetical protein